MRLRRRPALWASQLPEPHDSRSLWNGVALLIRSFRHGRILRLPDPIHSNRAILIRYYHKHGLSYWPFVQVVTPRLPRPAPADCPDGGRQAVRPPDGLGHNRARPRASGSVPSWSPPPARPTLRPQLDLTTARSASALDTTTAQYRPAPSTRGVTPRVGVGKPEDRTAARRDRRSCCARHQAVPSRASRPHGSFSRLQCVTPSKFRTL